MKTKPQSLDKIIEDLKFDYVNSDITPDLFPSTEIRGKVEILHPDKYLTTEKVIKLGEEKGLVPANIYELLEYAKDGWNNRDWVVALGSVGEVSGYRHVPYLDGDGSKRNLDLLWFGDSWNALYRFAFVRNGSSSSDTSAPLDPKPLELPNILEINGIKYKQV